MQNGQYFERRLLDLTSCECDVRRQGRIQKIQKEGAEETDDAVLHHSGSICDQTLGLTLRTFQKYRKKGGGGG